VTSELAKTDRRREAGERTRQRLLDATRALLAERGADGLTLREITVAAQANVAAVSYHFGSLQALSHAAIQQAIEAMIDDQVDRLRALGEEATLDEIATALVQPIITAIGDADCAERAFMRIVARIAGQPPCELEDWMAAATARADAELHTHLRRALPSVADDDLRLRMECAVAILRFLVSGGRRISLEDKSAAELERLFVPIISGALAAGGPTVASP
jgi:AcrR family transcriptional regulator